MKTARFVVTLEADDLGYWEEIKKDFYKDLKMFCDENGADVEEVNAD